MQKKQEEKERVMQKKAGRKESLSQQRHLEGNGELFLCEESSPCSIVATWAFESVGPQRSIFSPKRLTVSILRVQKIEK